MFRMSRFYDASFECPIEQMHLLLRFFKRADIIRYELPNKPEWKKNMNITKVDRFIIALQVKNEFVTIICYYFLSSFLKFGDEGIFTLKEII